MKKKQKITLYRIIITAVMLVGYSSYLSRAFRALSRTSAAYLVIGYDILKSRQGHPKRPRVRRKLFDGARHPRCVLPRHLDKERRLS